MRLDTDVETQNQVQVESLKTLNASNTLFKSSILFCSIVHPYSRGDLFVITHGKGSIVP